jgi:hypothetical protein
VSRNYLLVPAIHDALEKFLGEVTWTAAFMAQDRLGVKMPLLPKGDDADIFGTHPKAISRFVTGYALEEDTSLLNDLVAEIERALTQEAR